MSIDHREIRSCIVAAFEGPVAQRRRALEHMVRRLHDDVEKATQKAIRGLRRAFLCRGNLPNVEAYTGAVWEVLLGREGRPLLDWDPARPLDAYLFRIARNAIVDELRSERRHVQKRVRATDDLPDPAANAPDPNPGPERLTLGATEVEDLCADLRAAASQRELEVLELHFLQGLDAQAVADLLGKHVDAVYTAIRCLRVRIAKLRSKEP